MTDIYIVRHGNTFDKGDVVTRVGARTDLPLSTSGLTQARALADHFSETIDEGFAAAYCSDLQRTRQTAEAILNKTPSTVALSVLDFLKEVDYGPDENKPEDEVIARIGEEALSLWETKAIAPDGWLVDAAAIEKAWLDLFAEIGSARSKEPILIVTSNGIARFALSAINQSDQVESIKLKTGAFGKFKVTADHNTRVENWNQRPIF